MSGPGRHRAWPARSGSASDPAAGPLASTGRRAPTSRLRDAGAALGLAGAVGGVAYAIARGLGRRRASIAGEPGRATGSEDAGLEMPPDVRRHQVPVSDGGLIEVVERGEGTAIVLLHGAGLSSGVWSYQFHDLSGANRLVALDLRGHGASAPGAGGVTITRMADDLAEVLEHLDLRDVVLVGHSMGGMTALRFARNHANVLAERVSRVLLMSSAGGVVPEGTTWSRLGPLVARTAVSADAVVNRSARFGIPAGRAGRLMSRVGFGVAPSMAQVEATLKMLRASQPSHFLGLFPELFSFDERAPFTDFEVPVTVLVGDRDRLTPPALARQLAASLPGARLVVWPGGGHMLMYERREALDGLLEAMARAVAARETGAREAGAREAGAGEVPGEGAAGEGGAGEPPGPTGPATDHRLSGPKPLSR